MPTPPLAEDTLRLQILPSADPARYQITLTLPGIPLMGGPARRPATLTSAEEIQPLRKIYEDQIAFHHDLELLGAATPHTDPLQLIEIGRRVAQLLPISARQGLVAAVHRAQKRQRRLRIMLETTTETRNFLAVPWELLVLPIRSAGETGTAGEDFLLQDANVSLIRQVRGAGQQTAPQLTQPLTVQAFLAEPISDMMMPIESMSTRTALAQALSAEVAAAAWYAGAGTLAALTERLRVSRPQILHLLCHGEESGTGYGTRHDLIFTHEDGCMQRVSAFDLAPILSLAPQLQLVVLQACHSGTVPRANVPDSTATQSEGERRTIESIALTLVRQGVPAVVAMQGEVGQEAAGAFVRVLYAELAQGGSLDRAVAASRTAMRVARGVVDWSLPVVYQGSGAVEEATWYTRSADWVEATLREPTAARVMRGAFLAWVLVLLAGGVARWLLAPASAGADLAALVRPLVAWIGVGLVGPAIIATTQRGARRRDDVPLPILRATRYAQWGGAYLGYALGGLIGLGIWISLWTLGVLALLPAPLMLGLFIGGLVGTLGFSYVIARSQWRSALAITPVDPSIYTLPGIAIIIIGALILIGMPLMVFTLPTSPFAWLLSAEPAALALAGAIVTLVLGLDG